MENKEDGSKSKPPHFMAPKKRTTGKKGASHLNHGDVIMSVQGQGRSPAASPSDEDCSLPAGTPASEVHGGSSGSLLSSDPQRTPTAGPSLQGLSCSTDSRSPSLDLVHDTRRSKKKVNICTTESCSDDPLVARTGTSSSSVDDPRGSDAELASRRSPPSEPCLTLTGTIKRGRKAGQSVDVKLNMSREELEVIEAAISEKNVGNPLSCVLTVVFSALCIPLVFLVASVYNFYVGTMTWYNIFNYFSASKLLCYRVCFPPLLILSYPFLIVPLSLLLGLNAAIMQVSFDFMRWKTEVQDLEKGFFGWVCSWFKLEECSPYDVVIIMDVKGDIPPQTAVTEA